MLSGPGEVPGVDEKTQAEPVGSSTPSSKRADPVDRSADAAATATAHGSEDRQHFMGKTSLCYCL